MREARKAAEMKCAAGGAHNWQLIPGQSRLFCSKCANQKSLSDDDSGLDKAPAAMTGKRPVTAPAAHKATAAMAGSGRLEPTRVPCAGHKLHDPSCSNCRKEAINYPDSDPSKVACPRHKLHDRRCSDCMECHAEGKQYKLIPSHKACSGHKKHDPNCVQCRLDHFHNS